MARSFVSSFLLPLVRGGRLHVGRPLGPRAVERLGRLASSVAEDEAAHALAVSRRAVAARFLRAAASPPLDEATLRLGATVHDLLVLVHPAIDGPTVARRQARIAAAAQALASLGAPASAVEAVNRHSLLARLAEIARTDSTVTFWLGRETFVGRVPPPRVTALPTLRRVRVDVVRRSWLRDIGVPTVAHEAVLALGVASPLGEALDPLRLEPPLCWSRILPVLRLFRSPGVAACRLPDPWLAMAGCETVEWALARNDPDAAALLIRRRLQRPLRGQQTWQGRIEPFRRGWELAPGRDGLSPAVLPFGTESLGWLARVHALVGPRALQEPRPGS